MNQAVSNLAVLLASMEPVLHEGVYAFCVLAHGANVNAFSPMATVVESGGITIVVPDEQAVNAGLAVLLRVAWITLTVHSDLRAVGLTAAFSSALSQSGISCNVMSGAFHDHIFVPVEQARQALGVLQTLQQDSVRE